MVVTHNNEFAIFYTVDSIVINVVYLQYTGEMGESTQKSFMLGSDAIEGYKAISDFNVEGINYGSYSSGSFVMMTQV